MSVRYKKLGVMFFLGMFGASYFSGSMAASCTSAVNLLKTNSEGWGDLQEQTLRMEQNIEAYSKTADEALALKKQLDDGNDTLKKVNSVMKTTIPIMKIAPNIKTLMTKMNDAATKVRKNTFEPGLEQMDQIIAKARIQEYSDLLNETIKPEVHKVGTKADEMRSKVDDAIPLYTASCKNVGIDTSQCLKSSGIKKTNATIALSVKKLSEVNGLMEKDILASLKKIAETKKKMKDLSGTLKELDKAVGSIDGIMKKKVKFKIGPEKVKISIRKILKEGGKLIKKLKKFMNAKKIEKEFNKAVDKAMSPVTKVLNKQIGKMNKSVGLPKGIDPNKISASILKAENTLKSLKAPLGTLQACK